jgi:hypothetical protein
MRARMRIASSAVGVTEVGSGGVGGEGVWFFFYYFFLVLLLLACLSVFCVMIPSALGIGARFWAGVNLALAGLEEVGWKNQAFVGLLFVMCACEK